MLPTTPARETTVHRRHADRAAPPAPATPWPLLRQRLLRQALHALGDAGTAEDLVQDTLMALVQQAASHRGDASLETWATAILKHKVADWYRSPGRRRFEALPEAACRSSAADALFDEDGCGVEAVPAWQQPENHVERRQMMHALQGCVGCLPARSGRVFMMREWLGFETAEVCARLDLSAENCRMLLHRARTALRRCMQQHWTASKAAA